MKNILIEDVEETFKECLLLIEKKNNDYAGKTTPDVYKAFRGSTVVGVPIERAILVRIMDKISRLSIILNQRVEVKDEKITDTIEDAINYLAILKSFLKNG